ncbi:MAG: IPT/TIG domain-containing protein, partial [bacterium]
MRAKYFRFISWLLGLALGLALVPPIAAQTPDAIQYIYDSLNRLARVIDQTGEVATYNYDAVGNILSIERTTVDQLAPPELTSVTPNQVSQGESATLVFTGTSLLGGTVTTTHPGLTIEGSSGTDNQITAPVSVAVTAALGTATLTVTTVAGSDSIQIEVLGPRPLITGVTPGQGPSFGGTQVTVSGSHLTPDTSIAFGGNPATNIAFVDTSTLTAMTPAGPATNPPTAVDVVVSNPNGSDTLPDGFLYIFGIQFGQVVSADIAALGEEDQYSFTGTAGDQVLLRMSRTSGTLDPQLRVFRADGTAVPNCSASTVFVTLELTCVLDGSGPYTLLA